MQKKSLRIFMLALAVFCGIVLIAGNENVYSQRREVRPEDLERRRAIEAELQSIAIVERKLMIPMRDGTRIVTDVYRAERHLQKISYDLRSHALQLQLLGCPQRCATRSVE